jgi:hypothetical protein
MTGAIMRYEEKLRWAAAMGFPVALLEALSLHCRHHSIYAARSPHQLLRSRLLQQWRTRRVFPTDYNDLLSFQVEGH